MIPRPPISTLFPYTTLFRSADRNRAVFQLSSRLEVFGFRREPKAARTSFLNLLVGEPEIVPRRGDDPDAFARFDHGSSASFRHLGVGADRKSTRLNSSHLVISYAVFCLKKKKHAGAARGLRAGYAGTCAAPSSGRGRRPRGPSR